MTTIGTIVLVELEYAKYFVHFTRQTDITLESILPEIDTSTRWLTAFPPIKIVETTEGADCETYTIKYMEHYGVNHVRNMEYIKEKSHGINLDKSVYKSVLEKIFGVNEARKVYSQLLDREHDKDPREIQGQQLPINELNSAISNVHRYKKHGYIWFDVEYYNKTHRCDYCYRKDAHKDNCFHGLIRKLPHENAFCHKG
jgi:hypothetical protein